MKQTRTILRLACSMSQVLPFLTASVAAQVTGSVADGTEPAWSPDGRWIVISVLKSDQRDLFAVHPDGSGLRQITDTPDSELLATWSADGRLAYVKPTGEGLRLFVLANPLSGAAEPHEVEVGDLAPAFTAAPWAPDGMALTVVAGDYPELDVYRVPLDGAPPTPLVTVSGYDGSPAWSRSGRLAFASDRGGSRDIWVRERDGAVRQVTDGSSTDDTPAWSPDGRWIAYVSDRTGHREIHAMSADGAQVVQITDNRERSAYPAWSPDGASLAYVVVTRGRGNDRLFVVPVPATLRGR